MALLPPPVWDRPRTIAVHRAERMVNFRMGPSGHAYELWHLQGIWWWDPDRSEIPSMDHPNRHNGWVKVGPPFDPGDWWIVGQALRAFGLVLGNLLDEAQEWFRQHIPDFGGTSPDLPDPSPPMPPARPPGPDLPDPTDIPDGGDDDMQQNETILASSIPAVAALALVIRGAIPTLFRGMRIPWSSIPGWLRTVLIGLGFVEGADIIWDLATDGGTDGIGPFFGGDGSEDPTTRMVEAMTVSTWQANGVQFHRLSDGRLATRNKHGVWKIWRPKKPIVIFASGVANLPDLLRADRAIDKQAKKIAKTLRNRGYTVRKKTENS